jgi:hypothetical protein
VREGLEALVKHRVLPIPNAGPLADEEAWAAAIDLLGQSVLTCNSLPLTDVGAACDQRLVHADPDSEVIVAAAGGGQHDLRGLARYLRRLEAAAEAKLQAPLPTADRLTGSWTGDLYSDERLLELAAELYLRVLAGYSGLVNRWMPTLAPQLEHYVLMPMRVVGFIAGRRGDGGGFGNRPQLSGYLEPLPAGDDNDVAMQIGGFDWDVAERVYAQQRSARPLAARWITGTIGSMSFGVGERYAVSDGVYNWLARDLQRVGLVGRLAAHGSVHATVRWEHERSDPAAAG